MSGHGSDVTLIAEVDREHDFGTVIARPGRTIVHRYRLSNHSKSSVKIVDLINRKPCCGVVRSEGDEVRVGGTIDIEVGLMVDGAFGPLAHEAILLSDDPICSKIILRTTADVVPAIRVREVPGPESPSGSPQVSESTGGMERDVVAAGLSNDPPIDLDRLALRSSISVRWLGPKRRIAAEDGLDLQSRRFVALTSGEPGEHHADVIMEDEGTILGHHPIRWEVRAPLILSPPIVLIRPGETSHRVVIRARDRVTYRITGVESDDPMIEARVSGPRPDPARVHVLDVRGTPRSGHGRITIRTDLPEMNQIDLPVMVLQSNGGVDRS